MNHIKNLTLKELRVLLRYPFRPEMLEGGSSKVYLIEAVTGFLELLGGLVQRYGGEMHVVTN